MYSVILHTSDGQSGMIIIGLDEVDLATGLDDSVTAYHHVRLSECFPAAEDLLHEHVLLITASGSGDEDKVNEIIEDELEIDRVIENVQVCEVPPGILRKLRAKPAESHTFDLGVAMPILVVLLGGQDGVERWMTENLEKA
jgi:hypothetical protein